MLRYILTRGVKQDKRIDLLESRYTRLVENHLAHSTQALTDIKVVISENTVAVQTLTRMVKEGHDAS